MIARLGTLNAVIAGLSLIEDSVDLYVEYDLQEAIKANFFGKRPYGRTVHTCAQGSSHSKAKLFERNLRNNCRRRSAFALLGQIAV